MEFRKSDEYGAVESIREERVEENKAPWFINNSIWSRAFTERHLRPPRSRFFPVSSISSLLYFHHFRASPRSVYASVPTIGLCLRDCYIRPPTITPPSARLGPEKRGVKTYTKKKRERERKIESSITVTRPRRSRFSLDEYKSPVMTDRCRSDPSFNHHASYREKMSRGWREALRKNSIPCTEVLV